MCLGSTRILWGIPFQFPARNLENEYLEWFVLEYLMQSLPTKDRQKWNRPVVIRMRFVFIFKHLYYICMFQVIYQTWDAAFHHQMKHREESWKYDAQRSIFGELWGVSSGDETLCRMFDISSQTKSFLKEKLRMQILSSVSSDFQTLIKH